MKSLFTLNALRKAGAAALLAVSALVGLFAPTAHALSFTDYLEGQLAGHLFRGTAFTAPTTLHLGLLTSACSDSATGTEVTGGSYARVAITSNTTNWTAPSAGNGTVTNAVIAAYPTPTASWGTVVSFALYDSASAGNQLVCSSLTTSRTINIGDTVRFPVGSLTIQIDN